MSPAARSQQSRASKQQSLVPAVAHLAQQKAIASNHGVLIEWRTGFEIDNLGFNIYRELDGRRERLNPGIISGSALIAGQGTAFDAGRSYQWFDSRGTVECRYYLEDIDLSGHNNLHDAINPEWKPDLPPHNQARLLSDLTPASSAGITQREWAPVADNRLPKAVIETDAVSSLSDQWTIAGQPALKIGIRINGWYRITQPEMAAAGFDTSGDAGNLRMFVNASEIAIRVSRDNGPLLVSDYLEFWGESVDLPSTDTQIYWLVNGPGPGKRVARLAQMKIDSQSADQTEAPTVQGTSGIQTPWVNGIISGASGLSFDVSIEAARQKQDQGSQPTETPALVSQPSQIVSSASDRGSANVSAQLLESKPALMIPVPSNSSAGSRTIAGAPRVTSLNSSAGKLRSRGHAKSLRKTRRRNHSRKSRVRRNHAVSMTVAAMPSFISTIDRKARTVYATSILNGDAENFFGEVVTPGLAPFTIAIPSPDLTAPISAQMEITLQGFTQQDHQVKVFINGTQIDTMQFSLQALATKTIFFSSSLLVDGGNSVQLTSAAPGNDVSLLADIRVTYARSFKANNNTFQFAAKSTQSARIEGFTIPNIRTFDITDTTAVQEIKPIIDASGAGYAATIPAGSKGKARRLIALPDPPAHPASIALNQPSALNQTTNAADFLIISYKDFIPSLTTPMVPAGVSLVAQRQAQGFNVKVVDVEDIYDEFSFGRHTSQAIKDFLSLASTSWTTAPRYLLLLGDASYDPRNYISQGFLDFVPSKHVDTTFMETDSDDSLADFNNDGIPEISIGRLPARTLAQANLMVSKIVNFSPANVPQSALMVADWPNGYVFTNFTEQLLTVLPSPMESGAQRVYRPPCDSAVSAFCEPSDAAAHTDIINKINAGVALVNYSGHGNVDIWAGPILSSGDALGLNNGNKLPFVVVMDCLNGYFSDPNLECLAESFMKAPNGGAVATFASSGLTIADPQHEMGMSMFDLLYSGTPMAIGDASRQSKSATTDLDVRRTWILFGDPTMKIR